MSTAEQAALTTPGQTADRARALSDRRVLGGRLARRHPMPAAVATDALALVVAWAAALALTASLFREQRTEVAHLSLGVLWISGVWILALAVYGLYGNRGVRIASPSYEAALRDVFHPLLLGAFASFALSVPLGDAFGPGLFAPETIAVAAGMSLALLPAARVFLRSGAVANRPQRTIIVGSGAVAGLIHKKVRQHPGYGLEIVGYLDDEPREIEGFAHLGPRSALASVCRDLDIDRVIIAYSRASHEEMLGLVRSVRNPRVRISMVPRYFEIFPSHATLDDLEGIPMITLPLVRLGGTARVVKRSFDVLVSGGLLLLFAPVIAGIAMAIRIDSSGPAFFRQARRGRSGSTFHILKFRSMTVGAESRRGDLADRNEVDGPIFKLKSGDPRATRVGSFLRRTSLDELPQLWNVLRGQMSMVGPRPFVVHEADQITGWASRRLDVAPGLTGLWQAMGRNDLSYAEMNKLDYLYVTNWSLWWDIKIMLRTVRVVLRREGAY